MKARARIQRDVIMRECLPDEWKRPRLSRPGISTASWFMRGSQAISRQNVTRLSDSAAVAGSSEPTANPPAGQLIVQIACRKQQASTNLFSGEWDRQELVSKPNATVRSRF